MSGRKRHGAPARTDSERRAAIDARYEREEADARARGWTVTAERIEAEWAAWVMGGMVL